MIIRNFLNQESVSENCHEGVGEVQNTFLYCSEDF